MIFNSLEFVFFFILVATIYHCLDQKKQNILLLLASYFFYACWDWRFLGLIFISTIVDFFCARAIYAKSLKQTRKKLLFISVATNLGILGFFKYCDFFVQNMQQLALGLGWEFSDFTMNIVLPVGISFYTFQTMSYTIDVYRGKLKPIDSLLNYSLYVAFFPQLVAGPIERGSRLLPQLCKRRQVSRQQLSEGSWLIAWGMFKKIFIADNLAGIVDSAFADPSIPGAHSLLAVYAFAFQIFCDFSSYSDIARGTAKILGIELMRNFKFPYFVSNPQQFWRHWHISLSTWLRDYLYISLGGAKGSMAKRIRNLMLTMLLGGLWHGAAWTFIIWGLYHGLLLAIYHSLRSTIEKTVAKFPASGAWLKLPAVLLMFNLTCFGWLIFRASSMQQVQQIIYSIFNNFQDQSGEAFHQFSRFLLLTAPLIVMQGIKYWKENEFIILHQSPAIRCGVYMVMFYLFVIGGEFGGKQFYYFQF